MLVRSSFRRASLLWLALAHLLGHDVLDALDVLLKKLVQLASLYPLPELLERVRRQEGRQRFTFHQRQHPHLCRVENILGDLAPLDSLVNEATVGGKVEHGRQVVGVRE